MSSTKVSGDLGEDFAVEFLKKKGYEIIDRNFRTRVGEIDIVAVYEDTLVFVEVKTRWNKKFGLPEEAVTLKKLEKIKKTGQLFAKQNPNLPKKQRIDVVAIQVMGNEVISTKLIKVG